MDKEEIRSLIDEKKKIYDDIYEYKDVLVTLKSEVKYALEDLWLHTDWDEKITNAKPTDKSKKAYVDGQIREAKEEVEYKENAIEAAYNEIRIIDDKLKYLSGVDE